MTVNELTPIEYVFYTALVENLAWQAYGTEKPLELRGIWSAGEGFGNEIQIAPDGLKTESYIKFDLAKFLVVVEDHNSEYHHLAIGYKINGTPEGNEFRLLVADTDNLLEKYEPMLDVTDAQMIEMWRTTNKIL